MIDFTDGRVGNEATAVPSSELNLTAVERLVYYQINALRADLGTIVLDYNETLAGIADSHSEDMASRNYTSHVSPDGETVSDRYASFGYECDPPGELILFTRYETDIETRNGTLKFGNGTELADGIVDLWLMSNRNVGPCSPISWRPSVSASR